MENKIIFIDKDFVFHISFLGKAKTWNDFLEYRNGSFTGISRRFPKNEDYDTWKENHAKRLRECQNIEEMKSLLDEKFETTLKEEDIRIIINKGDNTFLFKLMDFTEEKFNEIFVKFDEN